MRRVTGGLLGRAKRQFIDDITSDPYLLYILVLAAIMAGFWFWHRIPNFATRDERWRINNPMVAVGFFIDEPEIDSLLQGIAWGRAYGATLYLYGIVIIPVFVVAFFLGQLDAFTAIPGNQSISLWTHWYQMPKWIWTWSLLLSRLTNVVCAVGCVYVLYRIGTTMRDRMTGRLSAILLSLTWGFLISAHEVGEDIPALFFLLLVVYCGLRYARTGDRSIYLAGCASGGIAIAFKLTAGTSVLLLGIAYLLYVRNAGTAWREALIRPRLIAVGIAVGAALIVIGYPSVFAPGLDRLLDRMQRGLVNKSQSYGWRVEPSWWWILRGYLHGLGGALFVAGCCSVVVSLPRLRERTQESDAIVLSIVGIGAYLSVYAGWSYVRTHHLLPTFPLLILILAAVLTRFYNRNRSLASPLIVVLLLSSSVYAGVGVLGYATQPRNEATEWLRADASPNSTIETYPMDPQEAAVPHGMRINHPNYQETPVDGKTIRMSSPEWVLAMPHRCPTYIELTFPRALQYLAPDDRNARTTVLSDPRLTDYYRNLLAGDQYPYTVVATFGPRPSFLDGKPEDSRLPELVRVGVVPWTIQYGDPQDMGIDQYTVILKRTGSCPPQDDTD